MSDQTPSNPSPEEAEALIWAWGEKDFCFRVLHLLVLTDALEDPDLRDQILAIFNQHYAECGSCFQNTLMAADNCVEPFKKRIYFNVYHLSQFVLMKVSGGDAVVTQEAEGLRISVRYPSYMDDLWVGGVVYLPSNTAQEALIILDVRDEAVFRDPRPLLQRLDEVSASEVQDFDQPSGRGIQWWTIVGDRPSRLLVRWQGETRSVADDWTLVSRYKRLVARHDPMAGEDLPGKAALRLRELALKYDGRSWFAGYVDKTLEYRAKDAWRRDSKDAFTTSEGADMDRLTGDEEGTRVFQGVGAEAMKRWKLEAEKLFEGIDLLIQRMRLEKHLTKRQQRILDLKADGLSDETVGARLGLCRETVNRQMKKIKKQAALKT